MKIKNLKCYLLGAIILTNSSFAMSCTLIDEELDLIRNKDFYDFLEENGIVAIRELHDIPRNYYEAEVSENKIVDDELVFDTHYERIERIGSVLCQGREFDYDYKVLKVERTDEGFEITSKVIENIDFREEGYEYVYKDNYVIEDGYSDVLIKYGKVIKR